MSTLLARIISLSFFTIIEILSGLIQAQCTLQRKDKRLKRFKKPECTSEIKECRRGWEMDQSTVWEASLLGAEASSEGVGGSAAASPRALAPWPPGIPQRVPVLLWPGRPGALHTRGEILVILFNFKSMLVCFFWKRQKYCIYMSTKHVFKIKTGSWICARAVLQIFFLFFPSSIPICEKPGVI